ncbi:hypothetical protein [Endozoicomonas elysicola]|uniref:Uncharacterized protein n=1 Tax=Endozoicomonas elysicola TaxID=305900 RepID=A0A081KC64_9GAMM|nr:hypothetical protein [Endozoicomonas elysicola]KEI71740.1 hypothetical protein GV64_14210 [Endozoicomonas elysicola]
MSFSERIDAAKQTYRNYLDAHPNSRLKTLKAFSKAVSSFCTRKVIVWEATKRLQPNEANAFLPELNKALKERDSSSHSSIDPKLSSEVVVQPAPSPEVATACADALRCIKEAGQDLSRFWGLLEQCSIVELFSLAQAAKETLENSIARKKGKHQLTSPYLEAINKKLIKKQLEEYINNYQPGLFRKSGVTGQYQKPAKEIAITPLEQEQLNNPDLLSSLFKAVVKSSAPFTEQLTSNMLHAASLSGSKQGREKALALVKKTYQSVTPKMPAEKAWFKDTLYLMKLAYQHAPNEGRDGLTDKQMLCNFFANSLFQFPKPEIPQTLTSEAAMIIRDEGQKQLKQAEFSLTILFSIED